MLIRCHVGLTIILLEIFFRRFSRCFLTFSVAFELIFFRCQISTCRPATTNIESMSRERNPTDRPLLNHWTQFAVKVKGETI